MRGLVLLKGVGGGTSGWEILVLGKGIGEPRVPTGTDHQITRSKLYKSSLIRPDLNTYDFSKR